MTDEPRFYEHFGVGIANTGQLTYTNNSSTWFLVKSIMLYAVVNPGAIMAIEFDSVSVWTIDNTVGVSILRESHVLDLELPLGFLDTIVISSFGGTCGHVISGYWLSQT